MTGARALWFDNGPVIINEDGDEVRLNLSWEEAINEWIISHP